MKLLDSTKKKRMIPLAIFVCIFLFLSFGADSCDTSPNSPGGTNVTSSTSASSNGAINCDRVQYKEACQMIKRRYEYLNDANKFGYFYGFVQGVASPVIEYVVQGGVFPTSDLVSNPLYQEQCTGGGSGAS